MHWTRHMVLRAGFAGSTPAFLLSPPHISPSNPNLPISLHFVPAVFLRVFPTGFPRFSHWVEDVPLPVGSCSEYAECTPFSLYHCVDKSVFIYCPGQLSLARLIRPSWRWEFCVTVGARHATSPQTLNNTTTTTTTTVELGYKHSQGLKHSMLTTRLFL